MIWIEPFKELLQAGASSSKQVQKISFVDSDALEKAAQRGKKKETGGMHQYMQYFPFGYEDFEIDVDQCFQAPDHYVVRPMEKKQVELNTFIFARSATRPASAAYLMPVNNYVKKGGIPMSLREVKKEKVMEYKYCIIDGQHSIYAAKIFKYQEMQKASASEGLVDVYSK